MIKLTFFLLELVGVVPIWLMLSAGTLQLEGTGRNLFNTLLFLTVATLAFGVWGSIFGLQRSKQNDRPTKEKNEDF